MILSALFIIDDVLLILQVFNSSSHIVLGLLTQLRGYLMSREDIPF